MDSGATLDFRLYPIRFELVAEDAIRFPPNSAGNLFRGALGGALRRISCVANCSAFSTCSIHLCRIVHDSVYARMFEPASLPGDPSGLREKPRGFVLRPSHLSGVSISSGAAFAIDVHIFDTTASSASTLTDFVRAFELLGETGIGARRSRFRVSGVTRIDGAPSLQAEPMRLDLAESADACVQARVEFRTPTELKSGGALVERPEFGVLFNRVRDRIATLRAVYGDGAPEIDFRGMGERAARVRMEACSIKEVSVRRRSSRTGQVHEIGGFVGHAEYSGHLAEFLPWLRGAEWTGVGRHTVWGNGYIQVGTKPDSGK